MKKYIRYIYNVLIVFFFSVNSYGQSCTYTYAQADLPTNGKIDGQSWSAGSTVCLTGNWTKNIEFINLQGTESQPTIIKNSGGKVTIDLTSTTLGFGIKLTNCRNVRLTGSGSTDQYGILIIEGANGIQVGTGTGTCTSPCSSNVNVTNIEIDHIEVKNSKIAGIMVKQDPREDLTVNRVPTSSGSYTVNWFMSDIDLHDNYVHDIPGIEGFYVGNSFYDGWPSQSTMKVETIPPYASEGVQENTRITVISGTVAIGNVYKLYWKSPNPTYGDVLSYTAVAGDNAASIHAALFSLVDAVKNNSPWNLATWTKDAGDAYLEFKMNTAGRPGEFCMLFPHPLYDVKIYNNIVKNINWDGIQLGSADDKDGDATEGIEIYNNIVENVGMANNIIHGNGIQIGHGTVGKCYNNKITTTYSNGIIVVGNGNNKIYNNQIIDAGINNPTNTVYGIFSDNRGFTEINSEVAIMNNTIINPKTNALNIQNGTVTINKAYNNLLAGASLTGTNLGITGSNISLSSVTGENSNYATTTISNVNFVDESNKDYSLKSSSPAKDYTYTVDVSTSHGITFDYDGNPRTSPTQGTRYDAGALEYITDKHISTGNISPAGYCAGSTVTIPYVVSSSFASGTVFKALLSGPTGSFGPETKVIGSLSSTTSGFITNAVIPSDISAGAGYRIRVSAYTPSTPEDILVRAGSNNGYNLPMKIDQPVNDYLCLDQNGPLYKRSDGEFFVIANCNPAVSAVNINSGADVTIVSGTRIDLPPGFIAHAGSEFNAAIGSICAIARRGFIFDSYDHYQDNNTDNNNSSSNNNLTSEAQQIIAYPNPSNGKFTIKVTSNNEEIKAKISIYDIFGKKVFESNKDNQSCEVDLSNYPMGLYVIQVNNGSENFCRKIILNK